MHDYNIQAQLSNKIVEYLNILRWHLSIAYRLLSKVLQKYKQGNQFPLFEILAEYKRCGISKKDVVKAMLTFNPCFLAKEIIRRKKSAIKDIEKCVRVANNKGLKQTAGTKEYPIFENR